MEWSVAQPVQRLRSRFLNRPGRIDRAAGTGAGDASQEPYAGGPRTLPALATSPTRAPPGEEASSDPAAAPRNGLELASMVIGDWQRTLRVVVLAATLAACIGGVLYVLQLRADRWAPAVVVAAYVVASEAWRRCRERRARSGRPPDQE
jgi:hypothetical protein